MHRSLFGVLVLLACGGPGRQGTDLAPGTCDPRPMSGRLPPVSAVVDSARLARDVGSITFATRGRAIAVTVVFGFDGHAHAQASETSLSKEETAEVVSSVERRLRTQDAGEPWAARLRFRTGANSSIRIERAAFCAAVLETASLRGPRQTVTVMDRLSVRRAFRVASGFRIRVLLSAAGEVMRVTDVHTGNPLWGVIHDEIHEWRYKPATADGVTMESAVEYEAWQLGTLASRIR